MKSIGFTLIEVSITLMILCIIFTLGIAEIKPLTNINKDVNSELVVSNIQETLYFGKIYSYYNKENLVFSINSNQIRLIDKNNKELKSYDIKNAKVYMNNKSYLDINENGYVQPETIYIEIENQLVYKITIRPGGNMIESFKV